MAHDSERSLLSKLMHWIFLMRLAERLYIFHHRWVMFNASYTVIPNASFVNTDHLVASDRSLLSLQLHLYHVLTLIESCGNLYWVRVDFAHSAHSDLSSG